MKIEQDLIDFRRKCERFLIAKPDNLANFTDLLGIIDHIMVSIVTNVIISQEQFNAIESRLDKIEHKIATIN